MQVFKSGVPTQKERADFINTNEPSTARLISRLEEKSFIKKQLMKKIRERKLSS
ncbi:hypothetical protein [Sulfurimonas sp.]|uniref:hypothetical protein n=1 Tax=Sulfurimonas sp. TaxID=2022749 RepID=UPI003569B81E